ncbi:hypothetical protein [Rhizobium sp. Leaf341]|uniref:hypothetical protein n=1 Tax=Rhizobium sp. Leaf341 TaxID=1736344 RepID=UPI000712B4B1|nr:hypothetical protein [Rhizobium sp. Leaf341]KQR79275.1 hypothetical protein ASG03_12045 [Rhizobium sp. Leaf341]
MFSLEALQRMSHAAKSYASHCDTVEELEGPYLSYPPERQRVPHPATFAKFSITEKIAIIEAVQRELDYLTEGVRSGAITPNHRGRGAALKDLRARQMRLNKLARAFGFHREWRLRVRTKAIGRPLQLDHNC